MISGVRSLSKSFTNEINFEFCFKFQIGFLISVSSRDRFRAYRSWLFGTWFKLIYFIMTRNRQILKLLGIGERFSFNYWRKISKGCQFIRFGGERMAIDRKAVKRKIKPCEKDLYEKLMAGEINEESLRYDFCYDRDNQLILPDVLGKE